MATEASNKYDPVDKVSSLQYVLYNTPYGSLSTMIAGKFLTQTKN